MKTDHRPRPRSKIGLSVDGFAAMCWVIRSTLRTISGGTFAPQARSEFCRVVSLVLP